MFYTVYSELCKQKGISPSAAAEEMGFNKGTVSYWKRKKVVVPSGDILQKVATYFDVTIDSLMENDAEKEKEPLIPSDEELIKLLDDPLNKELFEKMMKLTPENYELIHAQIDFLTSRQEQKEKE